jgi:biopolymer transport protein ExbD
MSAGNQRRGEMITGINVTPLVDVVLVLIVILMVTSAYIASQTIPLDLPKGATGASQTTTLAISIDASGVLYFDGEVVAEAELRRRVGAARGEDPDARAVIAADGDTSHRRVVHVIDLLRRERVTKYAIQVQPEDMKMQ